MRGPYAKYYESTIGACKKCNPKGFVRNRNGFTKCPCHVEYDRLKKLHDSGLPRNYWDVKLSEFMGDPTSLAVTQNYIDNLDVNLSRGIGLYFHGVPGIGKTLLASYILHAALAKNKLVRFYYFSDVLTKFTEAWRDEKARLEVETAILNSDLLIFDDFGNAYKSNNKLHESILDAVIRTRANNLKPVIITSNYDLYDIKSAYGGIIIDLFKESLSVVSVVGDSYRKRKMNEKLQ